MLGPGARRLAGPPAPGPAQCWVEPATVTAVTSGIATVSYRGATQDAAHLDSYTPTVADVVVLLVTADGSLLILGKPAGTPT